MKDKKLMISTIIGISTLILLVVGATYAYFRVPTKNNFTKTNASTKIDSIGTVTMMPGSELNMEITSGQMMQMNKDVAYYGSSEGTKTEETSEIIGTASVSGDGVFTCTYELVMNATGTNNMYTAVQGMSDKDGQVILTVNGVRYDFGTSNLFPKTISGKMEGLTEGVNQELTAQLKLVNQTGTEQNALIGTDINITFELNNFDCTATDMGTSGTYVMETSPANISTELVNGLYRFQGSQSEVTNNYICFGTNDKNECLNPNSPSLFRIIGITPDGQLKLVMARNLGDLAWHSDKTTDVSWPDSALYNYIKNAVNASIPSNWINIVKQNEWRYGVITNKQTDKITEDYDYTTQRIDKIIELEESLSNKHLSNFGMLTYTDVLRHSTTCYDNVECPDGWLHYKLKDQTVYGTEEWLLTKTGIISQTYGVYGAWTFHGDGISRDELDNKHLARIVMYLKEDLTITGVGTLEDPYMISI